jgi:hypothetical protein
LLLSAVCCLLSAVSRQPSTVCCAVVASTQEAHLMTLRTSTPDDPKLLITQKAYKECPSSFKTVNTELDTELGLQFNYQKT